MRDKHNWITIWSGFNDQVSYGVCCRALTSPRRQRVENGGANFGFMT
jgi:hypothetical protein